MPRRRPPFPRPASGARRLPPLPLLARPLALLVLLALLVPGPAHAKGTLKEVEREFREAIAGAFAAAVVCLPADVPEDRVGLGSSGVIVSRDGYVLSDGDVGAYLEAAPRPGQPPPPTKFKDDVEVRIADLEEGGFHAYRAKVVRRERGTDSTLLRIADPPAQGFTTFLVPASSAFLQVGDYTFVTGNAYGASTEAPPATTAGVVAALTWLPAGDAGGRVESIYTSAAVNPGVNGGPVVDADGRLVGTVSTFLPPAPGEPFQFLGKVVPMDRIRAVYKDLPEGKAAFAAPDPPRGGAKASAALATTYRAAAVRGAASVVSLEVARAQPLSSASPGIGGISPIPRFAGAVSGLALDDGGFVVTSLYNLTNVASLVFCGAGFPRWDPPPEHQVETGLRAITAVKVHYPGGLEAPARVVAHDDRLGIALLEAEIPAGTSVRASFDPAPEEDFVEGRMVVAVGNPYGAKRSPDPFLATGVLSKLHSESAAAAWRGQWQTDVCATDANCGGAVVDLRGRLLGMLQVWSPPMFGRNSGIAFIVPWALIAAALPSLKEGKDVTRGWLGVSWTPGTAEAVVAAVTPDAPAAAAGLEAGDRIVAVDGTETPTIGDVAERLALRYRGESVRLRLVRKGETLEKDVTLGERPKGT